MTETINFSDTSYLVHFTYDVPERLRNLILLRDYLFKWAEGIELIVAWEQGILDEQFDIPDGIKFIAYDHDVSIGTYQRTKGFNRAFRHTDRPAVILGDTDCIVDLKAIRESVDFVLNDPGVCVAHNGTFIDIRENSGAFKLFEAYPDIALFNTFEFPQEQFFATEEFTVRQLNALGGCIAVSSEYYRQVPECEHFVGWGYEDDHRVRLAHRLGFSSGRNPNGVFFHMPHESAQRSPDPFFEKRNSEVQNFMKSLSDEQLKAYVATWNKYH